MRPATSPSAVPKPSRIDGAPSIGGARASHSPRSRRGAAPRHRPVRGRGGLDRVGRGPSTLRTSAPSWRGCRSAWASTAGEVIAARDAGCPQAAMGTMRAVWCGERLRSPSASGRSGRPVMQRATRMDARHPWPHGRIEDPGRSPCVLSARSSRRRHSSGCDTARDSDRRIASVAPALDRRSEAIVRRRTGTVARP